jgi:hypothetical protein
MGRVGALFGSGAASARPLSRPRNVLPIEDLNRKRRTVFRKSKKDSNPTNGPTARTIQGPSGDTIDRSSQSAIESASPGPSHHARRSSPCGIFEQIRNKKKMIRIIRRFRKETPVTQAITVIATISLDENQKAILETSFFVYGNGNSIAINSIKKTFLKIAVQPTAISNRMHSLKAPGIIPTPAPIPPPTPSRHNTWQRSLVLYVGTNRLPPPSRSMITW